jgi:uncharacterized protein YndB with AHSA1/START domain
MERPDVRRDGTVRDEVGGERRDRDETVMTKEFDTEDVTVVIEIAAPPNAVFRAFTEDVDIWWQRGPKYRIVAPFRGRLAFEGGADGRFVHRDADGALLHEVGHILAWEPGRHLAFEWRGPNFAPGEMTEVHVHFVPSSRGTRVTLHHRGFAALPVDHPARHGQTGDRFVLTRGHWWSDVLRNLGTHVSQQVGRNHA